MTDHENTGNRAARHDRTARRPGLGRIAVPASIAALATALAAPGIDVVAAISFNHNECVLDQ